ncbi:MAG TPA: bifunctional 4-hydroxy-2-oxoglutarate aldolase/2-dehydro-3-deoxy-phosphogluconate aldolase [Streptosporangiaceae bacterium]|jgi:2-dehydro-3-deoxyphosphogluconate aldolase/(4S)-4-hydroxy-2-oxoglutarate aldolase
MTFTDVLRDARLVAIVRGTSTEASLATVLTLAAEGLRLIEVSLTTPGATTVIEQARKELEPGILIGAGTVLTAAEAAQVAEAGAEFVVTPGLGPGVTASVELGLPVLAGALTPSEVIAATQSGAAGVKLFPASSGGPAYLQALRDPFPGVPFVPVGGVDADAAAAYLAAGAVAVGVGSPLVGDAARGGPVAELAARARRFLAVAASAGAAGGVGGNR